MNELSHRGRVLISAIVVVGFIACALLYMTQRMNDRTVPEILSILLGTLGTNFTSVVSYWIGSSSSSGSKDETINNLSKPGG